MINAQREAILRAHIKTHLEMGGKLVYMGWGIEVNVLKERWVYGDDDYPGKCACALATVLVGQSTSSHPKWAKKYEALKVLLETNQAWLSAFVAGYDLCSSSSMFTHEEKLAFALGRKLHKEYSPTHAE